MPGVLKEGSETRNRTNEHGLPLASGMVNCPTALPRLACVSCFVPESALRSVELGESNLNRMEADGRVADALDRDDVRAVDRAQRVQAGIHTQVGDLAGRVVELRHEHGTGAAPALAADQLRAAQMTGWRTTRTKTPRRPNHQSSRSPSFVEQGRWTWLPFDRRSSQSAASTFSALRSVPTDWFAGSAAAWFPAGSPSRAARTSCR